MLNRPEYLDDYIQTVKELNLLTKKQKSLRVKVLTFLKENGDLSDLFLSKVKKLTYNEDEILKFIQQNYPVQYNDCYKKALDWEAVQSLVKLGKISLDKMPETCISLKTEYRIDTKRNKFNENNNEE